MVFEGEIKSLHFADRGKYVIENREVESLLDSNKRPGDKSVPGAPEVWE